MNNRYPYRLDEWYMYNGRIVYLVNTLFDGISENAESVECMVERPVKVDDVTICYKDVYTLKDGIKVELCHWRLDGMSFWDLSIDKEEFKCKGKTDFLAYLDSIGVYKHSVLDRFAQQWRYCGILPDDKVWRIQYYLENKDD